MLGWLLALLRAVPSLERLFVNIGEQLKQHREEKKYNEELAHIDAAMSNALTGVQDNRISGPEWNLDVDRSPAVSDGSEDGTGVHSIRIKGSGEAQQNDKE